VNPYRVTTQEEFEASLRSAGFEPTDETTDTGRFWRSVQSGKHILVPDPYEGMYPLFIVKDFHEQWKKMGQQPVN
jgi:hypothetical protein